MGPPAGHPPSHCVDAAESFACRADHDSLGLDCWHGDWTLCTRATRVAHPQVPFAGRASTFSRNFRMADERLFHKGGNTGCCLPRTPVAWGRDGVLLATALHASLPLSPSSPPTCACLLACLVWSGLVWYGLVCLVLSRPSAYLRKNL